MVRPLPSDVSPRDDSQAGRKPKVRRVLNLPLLIGTIVVVAVITPAAYCLRTYQVNRTSETFLDRADRLEKEEDWAIAATYLQRYLRLHPDDVKTQVRLAKTYDRSARSFQQKRQAINLFYQALGAAPAGSQTALHHRLAELLLEMGRADPRRFASAEAEARKLLQADGEDPQGWQLLALAVHGQFQSGIMDPDREDEMPLGEILEKALDLNAGDVELSSALARIYRDHAELLGEQQRLSEELLPGSQQQKRPLSEVERMQRADALVDAVVAAGPEDAEAFLARYDYRTQYGLPGAEADLDAALEHGPESLAVLLKAAGHAFGKAKSAEDPEEARQYVVQAQTHLAHIVDSVAPQDQRAYVGLGETHRVLGNLDGAIKTWRQGLEQGRVGTLENKIQLCQLLGDALMMQGQQDEAKAVLETLDTTIGSLPSGYPQSQKISFVRTRDMLRGRWHVINGDRNGAIALFKRVATSQHATPAEAAEGARAWASLAACYAGVNQWTRAASAYEEAASLQPTATSYYLAAAGAWRNAGRPEKTIRWYEEALSLEERAATWLLLAQARFQRQFTLPNGQRDWTPFNNALAAATNLVANGDESLRNPEDLSFLQVQYLLFRGEEEGQRAEAVRKATELLQGMETKYAESARVLAALVPFYERLGLAEDAERALKKFDAVSDKSPGSYLLRSRLYAGRQQYDQARQVLQTGLKELPPKTHLALQREMVQISLQKGDFEEAHKLLGALHERSPGDLGMLRQLAAIAWQARRFADLGRWEDELREKEGPDGLYWRYYRARRLLVQVKGIGDRALSEAERLSAEIQERRPQWPAAYLVKGMVLQTRGRLDQSWARAQQDGDRLEQARRRLEQAVDAYKEAIRLGERSAFVHEQLIALLFAVGRPEEAEEYLSRLPEQIRSSETFEKLEVGLAAGQRDWARAVELARRAIGSRPKDPLARMRLGGLLLQTGATAEAEAAFQKAVELAPSDRRTHDALFGFYVRTKKTDRAKEVLEGLVQEVELTDAQRALTLATGYRSLGDLQRADAKYKEAVELDENNLVALIGWADLKRQSGNKDRIGEAEALLRRVLELSPGLTAAKVKLAEVLAHRGGDEAWQEADRLLKELGNAGVASSSDRLQARFWLRYGGRQKRGDARTLLENIVADSAKARDEDRVLLAQVYEGEGKSQKARELYASLVGRVDPNPWHVTMYVDFLLRQPDLDGAKTWLDHLERHPDARESLGTARRKAQWLRAKGRTSEIESLVEGLAKRLLEKCKDDEETAQLASAVGNLYTTVRMHRAAVPWFQRLVSSPEPDAAQLAQYVDVLLRSAPRNESDDAWLKQEAATWLDKLEKLAPDKLTTAGLRARWLHARARTPEIEPLVEGVAAKLLAEAGDDQEQKARLALAIGGLYSTVEQHEAAKRWYEKLQGINRDVFAPLAMSLVQEGRMSEAITVCLQAAKSGDSARAAKILASLLVPPNRPDPEDFAQAEPLLARALKEHEDDFPLHFAVANVRIAQGRRDDAIGLYEKVLKSEPNHLLALNNLATLKSESDTAGDRQKAMGYVDRAIRVAGELPPLLDTKAMIFVYDGKPGQAVPLLKKATQMENADPRFHFHLAAAYDGLQNKKEAEAALTKARAGKVRDQFLTEKDEKLLQKLENKYPQPEAGKAS